MNIFVTGDATGGDVDIEPDFTQLFPKFAISLEQVFIDHDQSANLLTTVVELNLGEEEDDTTMLLRFTSELPVAAPGRRPNILYSAAGPHLVNSQRLGLPNYVWLLNGALPIAVFIGNVNLAVYQFWMWGWMWDKSLLRRGFLPVRP